MSMTNVAREAFEAFHSGDHSKCGQLLEQVSGLKGAYDVKVQHNSLVNDYHKSGCADPQALLAQLSQAQDRAREREKKDKGRRKREDEEGESSYREEEDLSMLRYNQALLCVQLRQHAQATFILEELFENIEPIDDFLAIKVCFLLLELCLLQREPEQAVAVLAYLEKPNAFLTLLRSERAAAKGITVEEGAEEEPKAEEGAAEEGESETLTVLERQPEKEASGPLPSLALGAFLPRHGRAPDSISKAEYKFYCLMYRARLAVLLRNAKAAKRDSKGAMEVLEELKAAPLLTPHAHTTMEKGAEDALKDGLISQHHAMVNVLKAYLEYSRGNVRKAMKFLTLCQFNFAGSPRPEGARCSSEEDENAPVDFHPAQHEACAALFFNNLGCIHLMMRKPNLAGVYFQKALRAGPGGESLLGAKAGLTLPGVCASRHWLDRRAEIAYNAGLQMLMCERPATAYKCFEQCAPVFRTWPRLWLRMAECCIEVHRQSAKAESRDAEVAQGTANSWSSVTSRRGARGSELKGGLRQLVWGMQGGGANRRWLLTTSQKPFIGRRDGSEEEDGAADDSPPSAIREGVPTGEATLVHAAMCLRNVLALAQRAVPEPPPTPPSGEAAGDAEKGKLPGAPGSSGSRHQARDLSESEASLLEDSALTKLAYVCLCQHDHSTALRHSRRLLEKSGLLPNSELPREGDAEEPRRVWTCSLQNLPHASGAVAGAKHPPSIACVTLAAMYAAEALLLAGKMQEARALLGSFISGNAAARGLELQQAALAELGSALSSSNKSEEADEAAKAACGGLSPAASVGGLTPAGYVLQSSVKESKCAESGEREKGKEGQHATLMLYPPCELPRLGDTQCTLCTNLAALHVQDGNLEEAEKACKRALQAQPGALAPLRTMTYIQLRRGRHSKALECLRRSRLGC